jgi:DNA-binding HxlR family transcriptional regulator
MVSGEVVGFASSHPEIPPRVEYSLTALGTSLLSTVLELAGWAADHHAEVRRSQAAYDQEAHRAASEAP